MSLLLAALSWYQSTYKIGVKDADTLTAVYTANGNPEARMQTRVHWAKGDVNYGLNQNFGTAATTKYDLFFKRDSGAWITEWSNGYVSKNNTYYGPWYMHYTTGKNHYGYKVVKKSNLGVASKLHIDFMLR